MPQNDMPIQSRIDGLDDRQVQACLQGILKGFVARNPIYSSVIVSSDQMLPLLRIVCDQFAGLSGSLDIVAGAKDPNQMKLILNELALDTTTGPWVRAWLDSNRATLLEPVTTAIALASIIMLLSTHIKLDVTSTNEKVKVSIHVEKKPSAEAIIKKFFGLF
jgi:hypothetical protein